MYEIIKYIRNMIEDARGHLIQSLNNTIIKRNYLNFNSDFFVLTDNKAQNSTDINIDCNKISNITGMTKILNKSLYVETTDATPTALLDSDGNDFVVDIPVNSSVLYDIEIIATNKTTAGEYYSERLVGLVTVDAASSWTNSTSIREVLGIATAPITVLATVDFGVETLPLMRVLGTGEASNTYRWSVNCRLTITDLT